jgi:hypothetical protein
MFSSREQRGGRKKGAAALALGAGAAGIAFLRRRRSAARNEPTGEVFAGTGHEPGAHSPVTDPAGQEPTPATQPDTESAPAKGGRQARETKESPE